MLSPGIKRIPSGSGVVATVRAFDSAWRQNFHPSPGQSDKSQLCTADVTCIHGGQSYVIMSLSSHCSGITSLLLSRVGLGGYLTGAVMDIQRLLSLGLVLYNTYCRSHTIILINTGAFTKKKRIKGRTQIVSDMIKLISLYSSDKRCLTIFRRGGTWQKIKSHFTT